MFSLFSYELYWTNLYYFWVTCQQWKVNWVLWEKKSLPGRWIDPLYWVTKSWGSGKIIGLLFLRKHIFLDTLQSYYNFLQQQMGGRSIDITFLLAHWLQRQTFLCYMVNVKTVLSSQISGIWKRVSSQPKLCIYSFCNWKEIPFFNSYVLFLLGTR